MIIIIVRMLNIIISVVVSIGNYSLQPLTRKDSRVCLVYTRLHSLILLQQVPWCVPSTRDSIARFFHKGFLCVLSIRKLYERFEAAIKAL